MVNLNLPDNASRGFKCGKCGHMFTARESEGKCPVCGFHCDTRVCAFVDASDEGY